MFRFIAALLKYLNPPLKWRRPPGQIINAYDAREIDNAAAALMYHNRARSPEMAEYLMRKHGTRDIKRLLELIPQQRRGAGWKARLRRLVMNYLGHQPGDPYRCNEARMNHYDPL